MSDNNIWSDEWGEQGDDWSGRGGRGKSVPRGNELGRKLNEGDVVHFPVGPAGAHALTNETNRRAAERRVASRASTGDSA
jgi:uncharacterized cupin superfamily protein